MTDAPKRVRRIVRSGSTLEAHPDDVALASPATSAATSEGTAGPDGGTKAEAPLATPVTPVTPATSATSVATTSGTMTSTAPAPTAGASSTSPAAEPTSKRESLAFGAKAERRVFDMRARRDRGRDRGERGERAWMRGEGRERSSTRGERRGEGRRDGFGSERQRPQRDQAEPRDGRSMDRSMDGGRRDDRARAGGDGGRAKAKPVSTEAVRAAHAEEAARPVTEPAASVSGGASSSRGATAHEARPAEAATATTSVGGGTASARSENRPVQEMLTSAVPLHGVRRKKKPPLTPKEALAEKVRARAARAAGGPKRAAGGAVAAATPLPGREDAALEVEEGVSESVTEHEEAKPAASAEKPSLWARIRRWFTGR